MDTTETVLELRKVKTIVENLLANIDLTLKVRTPEERDALVSASKCLHCEREISGKNVRGLHEHCRIKCGQIYTDQELMAANRLLPAGKGGRPKGDVQNALADAHQKADSLKLGTRKNNKKP